MGMDAVVGSMLAQNAPKIQRVPRRISVARARDDTGPEREDFFIVSTWTWVVDQKIHLIFLPIDMAQHLHQPGLDSPAIQFSEHVQNTHQAAARLIAESKTM